ncbi:hypothetical protein B0T16DRAFT_397731 [Cercophora newfieldiana]|uniref:Amidohydrolase-related domain-containing protein n=1 Tax=Cercophora newfieldiana TaxID=92897 RepID=A0AA39YNI7_9PEZI|nr:hypothetical protein B0T16DRAFT_397731 [Cercophora newfieldiana]
MKNTFKLHSSISFDPKKKTFVKNVSLKIERSTGTIVEVRERGDLEDRNLVLEDGDIDLRGSKIVLPGFVDSHTHVFLYEGRNATEQMRDESTVERTVRATNNARAALLAGYTTYRDLGTESLGNADANLRDCINRGLIPGPRLFVATEALASSGSYELRIENRLGGLLTVPRACDPADGISGVRAAVRRRIGDGADLIKFYADYRRKVLRFPTTLGARAIRFPPARRNPAVPLYTQAEMDAIVEEAQLAELPVAAHAGETRAAIMAARAGVTTIEHIFEDTDGKLEEMISEMRKRGTIWVPTLATAEKLPKEMFEGQKRAVKRAFEKGVRIAAGGDTGTFDHGRNAREMELLVEAGIPVEDVLEAGTVGGWEACGGDQCGFRFGWFEEGNRADVIALDADPRIDRKALRKVGFVMKDAEVWKRDGVAVGMVKSTEWDRSDDEGSSGTGRTSEEWSELGEQQPVMTMLVPEPVFGGVRASAPGSG